MHAFFSKKIAFRFSFFFAERYISFFQVVAFRFSDYRVAEIAVVSQLFQILFFDVQLLHQRLVVI